MKPIFRRYFSNHVITWAHTSERNVISGTDYMIRPKGAACGHVFYVSGLVWWSRKLQLVQFTIFVRDCDGFFLFLFCFPCSWASGTSSFWVDPITKTSCFPWRPLAISVYGNLRWQYHPSTLVPCWSPDRNRWREWHICGGQHHSRLLLNYTVMYNPCNRLVSEVSRFGTCNKSH